jgi:hypothetical protein
LFYIFKRRVGKKEEGGREEMKPIYEDSAKAIKVMKGELRTIPFKRTKENVITKQKINAAVHTFIDKIGYILSEFDTSFDMDEFDKFINHPSFEPEQRRRKR